MRFRIIPLEERILLDATALVDVVSVTDQQHQQQEAIQKTTDIAPSQELAKDSTDHSQTQPQDSDQENQQQDNLIPISTEKPSELLPTRVLVISSDVRNSENLQNAVSDSIKVVYYNANTTSLNNLVQQINDALNGAKADSIAFASNGQEGSFDLTDGIKVSYNNLVHSEELQQFWKDVGGMVKDGGTVDILACNVAFGDDGNALVHYLDSLMDSEAQIGVLASTDATGNILYGGNWIMETAGVDVQNEYFNPDTIGMWQGTLDSVANIVSEAPMNPQHLMNVNGILYFTATDSSHGIELWRSDGTEAGTYIVKDIATGSIGSNPDNLTNVNGTLYFSAKGDSDGIELWKTDGTASGTVLVKDINAGSHDSNPSNFLNVNGTLFFSATTDKGTELWKSDGTELGTTLVKDIISGGGSSNPNHLTLMNGIAYFSADSSNGIELWRSDGTSSGTYLVKDIRSGSGDAIPDNLTVIGNTLYFSATNGSDNVELWKSDGTTDGTLLVENINATGSSNPSNFINVNGTLFFTATNGTNGIELWKSDASGTSMVKDIYSGITGSSPTNFVSSNGILYFTAKGSDSTGFELWKSDGTASGTVMVKDINPGLSDSLPAQMVNYGGIIYFTASDGSHGTELWRSDGTAAGTYMIQDINSGANGSNPLYLTVVGGKLFFTADNGLNFSIGTTAGTGGGTKATGGGTGSGTNGGTTSGGQTSITNLFCLDITNDPPENHVPSAQVTNEDTALVFSSTNHNQITISDPDAGNQNVQVTLTVTNGTFSLHGTTGITFITGDGTNDNTMTFTGTISSINDALNGLLYSPTNNFNGNSTLTITTNDLGHSTGIPQQDTDIIAIAVNPVNDAPVNTIPVPQSIEEDHNLLFSSASGNAITVSDIDANTLQITLTVTNGTISLGQTSGITFSTGDGSSDTTMTFSGTAANINAALNGLSYAPTTNFSGNSLLTISTNDQGQTGIGGVLSDTDTVAITVTPVADAPQIITQNAMGNEDTPIPLSLSTNLVDTDGSETLTALNLQGIPIGATITDGTHTFTATSGHTSISILGWSLNNLKITPPLNSGQDFTLTVTATTTEGANGSTATSSANINVDVIPVADAPIITTQSATGNEDTPIPLTINAALVDTDGSEALSALQIKSIPVGAILTDGVHTFIATADNTSQNILGWNLSNLTIKPPLNSGNDFTLVVSAESVEGENGSIAVSNANLNVNVIPVADAPSLITQPATGNEDTPIALSINSGLVDTDGSEALSLQIGNIPIGAIITDGTHIFVSTLDQNSVNVTGWNLNNLTITPPINDSNDFTLVVTSVATETENGSTASTVMNLPVDVIPVIDTPVLTVQNASGFEDSFIDLNISSTILDASENFNLTIENVPMGATLTDGVHTFISDSNHTTANITAWNLSNLSILPAINDGSDFTLSVKLSVTEQENHDSTTITADLHVFVEPVADAPNLTVQNATGNEDTPIPLVINANLVDTDGSEQLSALTITNIPIGATLSDGTHSFTSSAGLTSLNIIGWDLPNLKITPTLNSGSDFDLNITATSIENENGDVASNSAMIHVNVIPVADAPVLQVADAQGNEDTPIPLSVSASLFDVDGSETLSSLEIQSIPLGATLTDGTHIFTSTTGNTSINVVGWNLNALTITPSLHDSTDFNLKVVASSMESENHDIAQTAANIHVDIVPVADAPDLITQNASGNEDTAIPLFINATLVDKDGSEILNNLFISAIPDGATLSDGVNTFTASSTNHSVDILHWNLANLTIQPSLNNADDFTLNVTATSKENENGNIAQSSANIHVDVIPVADAPQLITQNASGNEDSAIPLTLSASLVDTDSSEFISSILVSDIPIGATLSDGVNVFISSNAHTSINIANWNLSNLTITPPLNDSSDFTLNVIATSTEKENQVSASSNAIIHVDVIPVADAPILTATDGVGNEDSFIPISISVNLVDPSESIKSLVLNEIPIGATLTDGTNFFTSTTLNHSVDINSWNLQHLSIKPPLNDGNNFTMSVIATSIEHENNATANTTALINVDVIPVADAPQLITENTSGNEDTPIPLTMNAALVDADGSEALSALTIDNIPIGATLTDGTNLFVASVGNQKVDVLSWNLNNLKITPPLNDGNDFTLTVNAFTKENENGSTASTSASILVDVIPVADAPNLATTNASGTEDSPIPLSIQTTLVDTDGSELISSLLIKEIPIGATLSDGVHIFTATPGSNSVDVISWNLHNLTITPPLNDNSDFNLVVTAVSTEKENGSSAATNANLFVEVLPVNNPPITFVPDSQTTPEDSTLIFSSKNNNNIKITDIDSNVLQITLTSTNGTLTLPDTSVLKFSTGDGNADASITFTGTLADINKALDGLMFNPNPDYNGHATITVTTNDQNIFTDTKFIDVVVTPVNDAPTIANLPAAATITQANFLTIAPTVADIDTIKGPVQVTLQANNGAFSLASTNQINITQNSSSTLTFTGNIDNINKALNGAVYTPSTAGSDTITMTVNDMGNVGQGNELIATQSMPVTITPIFVGPPPANPVVVQASTGDFTITPQQTGQDGFTFATDNGALVSVTATVEASPSPTQESSPAVVPDPAPLAQTESAAAQEAAGAKVPDPAPFNASNAILGKTISTVFKAPTHGVITANTEGAINYTPIISKASTIDFVNLQLKNAQQTIEVKLIVQVIIPEYVQVAESKASAEIVQLPAPNATEVAQTLAQGALTFTSSSTSTAIGKGGAQFVVKHDDMSVVPEHVDLPAANLTTEAASPTAHTVAAFAIQSDTPVAETNDGDTSHQNMVADALKELLS